LLVSFGFKYGMPLDADLVFDVRFLPNPHYVEHLRSLTGRCPGQGLSLAVDGYHKYFRSYRISLNFNTLLHPRRKVQLVVSIGCTGGKHRSVALADELGRVLSNRYRVHIEHRDIDKA